MIKTGLRDTKIALMETAAHCPFKHMASKKSLPLGSIAVTGNWKPVKTQRENMLTFLIRIDRHSVSVLSKL